MDAYQPFKKLSQSVCQLQICQRHNLQSLYKVSQSLGFMTEVVPWCILLVGLILCSKLVAWPIILYTFLIGEVVRTFTF